MTNQQTTGWDRAEFQCGRCWETVTADTEIEFIHAVAAHKRQCVTPPKESYPR